ncbi:hypothetical protein D9V86_12720 [Bacteroidetes/Chlorobi group bacterium ChocPot_Mid]|nr:MAG: hypothetical protein D9V86_12720 [Bacteroidetes/Chlorobi group bacterium ChocPot_Mid]
MRNFIIHIIILLFVIAFSNIEVNAQKVTLHPYDLRISMAVSQTAVNDWKQGEVVSFDWNSAWDFRKSASFDFSENMKNDSLLLRFRFYFASGVLYKNDKKNKYDYFLPTDNIFGSEAVLVEPLGWKLDPFFSASFFTQIVPSFIVANKELQMTAKFWDPVTAQQTWGFEYSLTDTEKVITSRLGISLKQIRAHDFTQMTDDRKTPEIKERWKPDSGIQWKSEARVKLIPTCDYKGILDLFTTFDDMTKCVVTMQNEFKFSIWGYLAILFKIDLSYDEKIASKTQYVQSARFGIVVDTKR